METTAITEVSVTNVAYISKCSLLHLITSEKKKVFFVIKLLAKDALSRASLYVEQDMATLKTLVSIMNQVFDDPKCCPTMEAKLNSLQQGRRSVAEYTVEFQYWVSDITWNPAAQKDSSVRGSLTK